MSELLKQLKEAESKARKELTDIRCKILEEELRIAKERAGVFVGCIVVAMNGERYKVSKIDPWGGSTYSLSGHKEKIDGGFGIRENYIGTQWKLAEQA